MMLSRRLRYSAAAERQRFLGPPRRPSSSSPSIPGQGQAASAERVSTPEHLVEVEKIAKSVNVRLTLNEMVMLRKTLRNHGSDPQAQFKRYGENALKEKTTREICLNAIANPENPMDKWGVRVISFFDYAGTALFSVVGTQVAGDSGMNMVGCTLVGCVAALGGGSLNAVLYGGASSLLGKPGVRWVANPSYLLVAIVSSFITFFGWPYYCQTQANHYIENVVGKENLDPETGHIGKDAFLRSWQRDTQFQQTIRDALPKVKRTAKVLFDWKAANPDWPNEQILKMIAAEEQREGELYFREIDENDSGGIDMRELTRLVQRRFHNGWETYWLDTLGLSSLSVAAVIMAIRVGLHPLVAATSGVTVCFGGILRDLLCGRDLAIGGQSYAMGTGASSAMYIFLRELSLRRIIILPLVFRTFASAGTCVGLRGWEWFKGEPLLTPMHGKLDHAKKNKAEGGKG